MKTITLALLTLALVFAPAHAEATQQGDNSNILDKVVNIPSPKSWTALGLAQPPVQRKDDGVQGGIAMRFAIPGKGANPWDITARAAINKPVKNGDVIFLAFWARAEVPAEGQQTAIIPGIQVEETAAPYTALARDTANVSGTWAMYYASGVATKDYDPGTLTVTLHLAAAKQTIDLGPVFVVDLGPNYDRSKLLHNKLSSAGPAPAPISTVSADTRFAAELARIGALLPVRGQLMNDPSVTTVGAYGPDQSSQIVPAADVPGGQALRVTVTKGGETFANATASGIHGDIHKGDVIFMAFYARAAEVSYEAQSGVISAMNVQMNASPWTIAAGTAALVPLNTWRVFYANGVAPMNLPSGTAMLTAQIGGSKQTIDFGPAFVLNLGPGVKLSSLPVDRITYSGREPNAP